ncbi:asparagine synthase-related protein [Brevundimonas sp.]|uniref:asparagine synthase-related protein n=1 Tax=Brevundimonas sp. TaxID=1871086 RepID=UPI0035145939
MFAGIVLRNSRADVRDVADADTLLAALTPYAQADIAGSWQGSHALLVQALTRNTAESRHEAVPETCAATGRVIVSWVRLDNRADLCAQLDLELRETLTDPQIILAAHRVWGEACAARLEGDFSFLIHDPERHTVFCARDAVGAKPFFYHLSAEMFVFASTATIYPALRNFDASPSREWLARFLIGESSDPVKTAYSQVSKLAPGHSMTVGREGPVKPARYFAFTGTAAKTWKRDPHWVEAYREAFHRAVDDRLRSAWRIGAENSGGLDSATIIGRAVDSLEGGGSDLPCFSVCHMADEPHYILDLAMYCGIEHNSVLTRPTYQPRPADIDRAIRVLGYPPEHSHALFHVPFFEQAQAADIRTLLSGFGGDEIVTSSARFLSRELLLNGRYTQLFRESSGKPARRAARVAAMLASDWRGSHKAAPRIRTPRLERTLLRRDVLEEYQLAGFNQLKGEAWRQARTLNEHLLAQPSFRSFLVGRLEGCTLIAASYGIDYRWPMLDRRLMAQYLATPSIEKRHRQWGRYLHRRACVGTVPDKILWKETKALGNIPHLGRDRHLNAVDVEALPDALVDVVDRNAAMDQARTLDHCLSDERLWVAKAPERNNLQALATLATWLK